MIHSTQENEEITTDKPRKRTTFQPFLNQEFFFGSRVAVFSRDPSRLKYWLLHPFFYKEATCKSSTIKEPLYTAKAVPSKDYFTHLTLINARKGTLSDQPRLWCITSTALLCCWGRSCSKIWLLQVWLWDACHMAGVRWGSCCEGFLSEEGPHYHLEQSMRKLS
jgi:hypothetical protein